MMKKMVSVGAMLGYLQDLLDAWHEECERYGDDDRIVNKKFAEMIGCKEMIEWLIGVPVNLGKNGNVSVGF